MQSSAQNEIACKSCGQPVSAAETELVGSNFIYWKVYRCKKCLHKRRLWTLAVCFLMLFFLLVGYVLSR